PPGRARGRYPLHPRRRPPRRRRRRDRPRDPPSSRDRAAEFLKLNHIMGLIVIHPGVSATVQDRGRAGYREWGIPVGGAFDRRSAALANALLGNAPGCAVIELTLIGGTYEARVPLAVALAGA